jgi:LPXTG-motif cell wall-anchored protein
VTAEPGAPAPERPETLGLAPCLWLFALLLATVFLVLVPLGSYALFGSDSGEYYALSLAIAHTGHLPGTYLGWGNAYPDFPGIFLLSAETAGASGASVLAALTLVVPALGALSVLPLFLLFRRIFPNDTVAILGAGLASVAFPRIFSIAHPAPLALGDLLVVAALWMFVEGRRDARWYGPLALTAAALIVTHHLSSYFFILSALGSLVLLELVRPGLWSARFPARELVFGAGFLLTLFAYWTFDAPGFLPTASLGAVPSTGASFALFAAAALLLVAGAGLLLRWRRHRPWPTARVRFPSDRSTARDFALLLGGTFGGILLLTVAPLPGTSQETTATAVLFFAPFLALVPFAAGTRRLLSATRLGPWLLTWLVAVGGSAAIALATSNPVLSASRHAEYLVIPLGLIVAVGLGRLVARAGDRYGRPAMAAGGLAIALLIGANAAIAYPPPADFGGFQEGITTGDAALWGWSGPALPAWTVLASDHRLSSMLFGFDGFRATWDSTPALFTGSSWPAAAAELNGSYAPHTVERIDAVAVDGTMRSSGVALDPSSAAVPMSASAIAWLDGAPFVPLYENGPQAVYWVVGALGS